ncbi:MAG: hypothetical protein C4547_16780 [Phycisphaerales bacterium]|nr:MAG: hypothetical protein C4547_16780 [Phycisphaerales bacterium]
MHHRLGVTILLAVMAGAARAGDLSPDLRAGLDAAGADQVISVVVCLDPVDLAAIEHHLHRIMANRTLRHRVVVEALQTQAAATQGPLLARLHEAGDAGRVASFESFWIGNVVRVDGIKQEIEAIAARPDVRCVYPNYRIEPIDSIEAEGPGAAGGPEPGIVLIQADRVWNELGVTGAGALAANIDTGVDGDHPAMESRWRGLDPRYEGHPEWAWYDPLEQGDVPYDTNGHGSHTMGTIIGGLPGDEVGVAPGAQWIAAAPINRGKDYVHTVMDIIRALQWMADPDGNPNTDFDVPHTCNHSWGLTTQHGFPPCDDVLWDWIDASEAAGTSHVFAAGNEGGGGLRRPADRASTDYDSLAVAACDGRDPECPIASFSSRGPTNCTPDGRPAIKPDIAAPGVNVRSCTQDGDYRILTGTSMSTPHISGVLALVYSANPDLTSDEAKQIIYDTATDKGDPGEDNSYGWGLVNAYDAVILAMGDPQPYACCFDDGGCEDLLRADCLDRGGRLRFGEVCETFHCPRPGACCVTNSLCEITQERDCLARGGDFLGEGIRCRLACPCDVVRKLSGTCKDNGTLKATLRFKNESWDGRVVTFEVGDGPRIEVTVRGRKAVLHTCCYHGPQEVKLLNPEDCLEPIVVDCR